VFYRIGHGKLQRPDWLLDARFQDQALREQSVVDQFWP
jgi:hypothetical protein